MKKFLKNCVHRVLTPLNLSLVGTLRLKELLRMANEAKAAVSFETHLARMLQVHSPDCVFDVGAHEGCFGNMLRALGYKGWIVSFEPLPALAKALRVHTSSDDKWMIEEHALGDVSGQCVFHQMAGDVFSSFLLPDQKQPEKYRESNTVVNSFTVPVRTVDEVWTELKAKLKIARFMLKMDTQGFDLQVFAGATGSISDIDLLMSELSCIPIYEGAPSFDTALTTFAKAGFNPSILAPISFTSNLETIEMDGLFLRASASRKTEG